MNPPFPICNFFCKKFFIPYFSRIITACTFIFLFSSTNIHAQNDSLRALVNNATSDTAKFRICNRLSVTLSSTDNKSSIFFAREAEALAKKANDKRGLSEAMNNLGYALYYSGKSDSAILVFLQSIKLSRMAGDSNNVIFALNRLGFIYREKGDYPKALIAYNQALASNVGEKFIAEAANSYLNIGVVYHDQNNLKDALRYEETGLNLYRKTNDEGRIANSLARIGNIYLDQKDSAKALDYYQQSMALFSHNNNQRGVAVCLNNIGNIYDGRKEKLKALDYYNRALAIRESIGDKNGVALICNNIANNYLELKQYEKAIYFFNKSLTISRELDYRDEMKSNYLGLSSVYESLGDDKKALDFYKHYHAINDSLFNDKNNKQVNELNTKFDTERRQKQIESLSKETELSQLALQRERTRNWFMISAVLLLVVLVAVVWQNATKSKRANQILKQQKNEITLQKKIVEEQNRDILDSINYAQRIQHAVLPSQDEMHKLFPQSFVFFRPRDIVSGDFWWIGQSGDTKIVAVADCTGHGVPGAFMSLIGNTALNEVVKEKHISDPGEILTQLAHNIVAALKQENKTDAPEVSTSGVVKDGMDIALCCIDEKAGVLKYSGANNPLYFIRNGKMEEIKGDRQPVGIFDGELKPFTVHTLLLKDIDAVYIFTDGFADQFGGESGKKFKYSQLKQLLFDRHKKSPSEQEQDLEAVFQKWRGNLDQVDDVLVAGIKIG